MLLLLLKVETPGISGPMSAEVWGATESGLGGPQDERNEPYQKGKAKEKEGLFRQVQHVVQRLKETSTGIGLMTTANSQEMSDENFHIIVGDLFNYVTTREDTWNNVQDCLESVCPTGWAKCVFFDSPIPPNVLSGPSPTRGQECTCCSCSR